MKNINEQLIDFVFGFSRKHSGLMPNMIKIHIEDYIELIKTSQHEHISYLQFDYQSPSIYERSTFMGIPIVVYTFDNRAVWINGYFEDSKEEVQEKYEFEKVEG